MFDMKKHAAGVAYKLVIIYDEEYKKYTVCGYTGFKVGLAIRYALDGDVSFFDTMEDAIKSITEYPND